MPQITNIHYITDSPVSQYRNKYITKIISMHGEYFEGIHCTWDYLESGHGKGPCDGVGGSLKRFADNAVKKGVIINNAVDFFEWASENNDKMTCLYVTPGDVSNTERMLRNAQFVKGLSKCHTIRPFNGFVYIRTVSCYKMCCDQEPTCEGWEKTNLRVTETEVEEESETDETEHVVYQVGATVEASYNGKVYRGEIMEYEEDNKEYNIKFMKINRAGKYIWPKSTWSSWIPASDIVSLIQ